MTALEVPDDLAKAELYPANESVENFPKSAKPSPFRDWLAQRLKERGKLLLVLDNWESAQNDTTLEWLSNLFGSKGLSGLHCLVTSRVHMGLTNVGETFEIDLLQVPNSEKETEETESGKLFIERARQRADGWEVTPKNRPHLFQILKTLEGHPLGIELVAAGVKGYLGLTEIVTKLSKSLLDVQKTRAGQIRSDHERHASLEASLKWSVERLPNDCRTAFPRVGAFPADFSGEAAMEVADIKEDWLTTWLNASLLTLFSTGPNRYEARPVVRDTAESFWETTLKCSNLDLYSFA